MDSTEDICSAARIKFRDGDHDGAIAILRSAIEKSRSPSIRFLLATIFRRLNDPSNVLLVLSEPFDTGADEARRFALRGQAFGMLKQFPQACQSMQQSLSIDWQAHRVTVLASFLDASDRHAEAVDVLTKLVSSDMADDEAILLLAYLQEYDNPVVSHALYARARGMDPGNALAWAGYGKLCLNKQVNASPAIAIASLKKAIELGDTSVWTKCYLGNALWTIGAIEEAQRAFEDAARDPDHVLDMMHLSKRFFHHTGRRTEFVELWDRVLRENPSSRDIEEAYRAYVKENILP